MDFASWSSTLLKLNGYEGPPIQQQQPAGLLSSSWPWISDPTSAARPALLLLDLAVLEAANHFWHPTSTSSLAMANLMSSRIMDKQHQLSFGIDRILGNQVGANLSAVFPQVPTHVWSGDRGRDSLSVGERQEITVVAKQVREIRQGQIQQQDSIDQQQTSSNNSRRKRSWSRAVFSNLQRKGLEKRFQLQKYITKPDRRQLAAALQLTDAQVKVWFQNRRMKWRHNKEPHLTNELSCNSPVEHCTDVAENLSCMDDIGSTSQHVLLPKSHPARFQTFKKP